MRPNGSRRHNHSLLVSGSYFPPQVGGISTMMAELCVQLGGDRVAVITGVPGPAGDTRLDGVRVHRTATDFPPRSRSAALRLIGSLGIVLARERPAVVLYASIEDAFAAHWTHKVLGYRHIVFAHGNDILSAAKSAWGKPRAALLAAGAVVANSRYTAGLLRDLGVTPGRVKVVHPGVDLDRFVQRPVGADERARWTRGRPQSRLLLSVGNLVERKGHDTVIRALAKLQSDIDLLYLIAGDGPHRAPLQALAATTGVADRVVFLGYVPAAELPLLYSAADLFVMPSRERPEQRDVEGFGIVFIEAAACCVPAIGGRSGGIEDAVVDGETGSLVDPHDADALAAAIRQLLADPPRLRRLGEAARRRAAAQFSWVAFGRAVASIIDEAVHA